MRGAGVDSTPRVSDREGGWGREGERECVGRARASGVKHAALALQSMHGGSREVRSGKLAAIEELPPPSHK